MVLLILYLHVHTTVNLIKLYDRAILMALRNQPPEAYELLDQRDEAQILAEIKGQIINEMFYSFRIGGKEVTGISWVGTKEIARQYGNVHMDFVDLKDMDTEYMAIVRATDTRTGTGMLGTSIQSKQMEIHDLDKDGKWLKDENGRYITHLEPDKFASTKAISKAQRNAIRAIIPERFLIEMYEQFKKGGTPEPRRQIKAEVVKKEDRVKAEVMPKASLKAEFQASEDQVKATLEANGVDTKFLVITRYSSVVRVTVQEGYEEVKWVDDHQVITKLLKGVWNAEDTRWEVPVSGS